MLAMVVLFAVPCIASGASKGPAKLMTTQGFAYMLLEPCMVGAGVGAFVDACNSKVDGQV